MSYQGPERRRLRYPGGDPENGPATNERRQPIPEEVEDPWYESLTDAEKAAYHKHLQETEEREATAAGSYAPDYDTRYEEAAQQDRREVNDRRNPPVCEHHGRYPRPYDDRGCPECVREIVHGLR